MHQFNPRLAASCPQFVTPTAMDHVLNFQTGSWVSMGDILLTKMSEEESYFYLFESDLVLELQDQITTKSS